MRFLLLQLRFGGWIWDNITAIGAVAGAGLVLAGAVMIDERIGIIVAGEMLRRVSMLVAVKRSR